MSRGQAEPGRAHNVSRWVIAAVILILGAVAAVRVELSYLPIWTFPELEARLSLAQSHDVQDLTRRYVVPLESAIRSLGQVRTHSGEVSNQGAELRVRFDPGVDAERKAARLESELQSLRRSLPTGASISIEPVQQGSGGGSTVLWLPGEPGEAPASWVRALEDLPEVQEVWIAGRRRLEVRLTADAIHGPSAPEELRRSTGRRSLGRVRDGHFQPRVWAGISEQDDPADLVLSRGNAAIHLGALSSSELRREEARLTARVDGRPGRVLLLYREYDASPLAFSQAVRRVLDEQGVLAEARFLVDESEPLRTLLRRIGVGLVAASLLLFLLHSLVVGPRWAAGQLLVLPLATAAALNAAWISGTSLDVTTLPALVAAIGAVLIFQTLRIGVDRPWSLLWVALSAACLPVAVVLMGDRLGELLGAPARWFAIAAPVGCLAAMVVPALPPRMLPWTRKLLQTVLRNPWAVLLGGLTAGYLVVVVFGSSLTLRSGRLVAPIADISIQLRFEEGSTLAEAEREVARVEDHFKDLEEVVESWSLIYPRSATVGLRLREQDRTHERLRSLSARYEAQLSHIGASLTAAPLAGAGGSRPMRFDSDIEEKAETDREATFYRFVLRSTDLERLQTAYQRIVENMAGLHWRPTSEMILPDWGEPSPRVELIPLAGVSQASIDRAVSILRERTVFGGVQSVVRLPGAEQEVTVRIAGSESPRDELTVADRRVLLRAPLSLDGQVPVSPLELFQVRQALSSPVVKRQGGSFVLPVTVRFLYLAGGQRPLARTSLARSLLKARLPPGVSVERPRISFTHWTPERRRLLAIASTLPLLLLGLTICRLSSVPLGFAALTPLILAWVFCAPAARALQGHMDEMMLVVLAAVMTSVLPLAAEVAAAVRVERATPLAAGHGYRWLTIRLPAAVFAALACAALFALPTWGLDAERFPWVSAFVLAAVAGPVAILTSLFFLPVLLRSVDLIRLRDKKADERRKSPPAWRDTTAPVSLSTRNLCKVYGNGFQALRSVDFHLEPGIIGLLGPNGAGKTTLLRTLCGLLEPSRGQVLFRGEPVTPENRALYRRLVGFLPQSFNAHEGMTVKAFLDFWGLEIGLNDTRARRREIGRVLEQVGLESSGDKKVRSLSGGMRRRIGIARALLGSPPILIVDEPTTGLDVESRNRLRESLLSVASERIILFSTHIASDVAAAASRILLMNGGRLLFDGSAGELIDQAQGRIFETLVADDQLRAFSKRYRVTTRVRTLEGVRVRAVSGVGQAPAGELVLPNLEEAYLAKLDLAPKDVESRRTGSLLDLHGS